ncbi:hypothetical protein CXG81DRAFT_12360 [Caulochytrium protostelioides]|uniref:USP domain-containing protein n=1 Tax=Caulochytrium protostelioides TaxID=1555241 RepID=A0A4P9X7E9_9FUNG|nr:hypothetical protein CXG81DRAFT_12360 [Caulochytrium protostelioides]|eukprot:RKP01153.1 hypothetical protein CXG81DRAFT_12360 [Caulochytrium protostelioides]
MGSSASSASYSLHGSTSHLCIPDIIVYPPSEDPSCEPCISYNPHDGITGIDNPDACTQTSLYNAMFQVYAALPDVNEELPVASHDPAVRDWVDTTRYIHTQTTTTVPLSVIKWDLWKASTRRLMAADAAASHVPPLRYVLAALHQDVISRTLFGKRFAFDLLTCQNRVPTGEREAATYLRLDMSEWQADATVGLVPLLNHRLGHKAAEFFFGGSTARFAGTMRSTPQYAFKPGSIFASLNMPPLAAAASTPPPAFPLTPSPTTAAFPGAPARSNAPAPRAASSTAPSSPSAATDADYHPTNIELPMDLDLGCFAEARRDQKTFYGLHGFVTQSRGRFITYTRVRGDHHPWYKCRDGEVTTVELGHRVASRGVMLAIYRQIGS